MKGLRLLAVAVMLGGLVSLVIGIVFITQSVSVKARLTESLAAEKVDLGLPEEGEEGYIAGNLVDTAEEAQAAQDILEEHLRENYGTYGDTGRGSEERSSYLDGTTLRNSLNLAVAGFGVAQIALAAGVVMITSGLALGGTGIAIYRLA